MRFERDGISLSYPDDWQIEREETEAGWTITLQSPATLFLLLSNFIDMPEPEEIAEAALAAMRVDYPDLEAEEIVESVAGQPAVGHDMQFFALDLTNTCWTRSFFGPSGTVHIMWQATDSDLDTHGSALEAVMGSLKVEED